MTREDIIKLAREAGFESHDISLNFPKELERFAALIASRVAAAAKVEEREACAKVAEAYEPRCDTCPSGVANAIRARGETSSRGQA